MGNYIGKPFESINPHYRYISWADKQSILERQQGKCPVCGYEFHYDIRRYVIQGTGEIVEYKRFRLLGIIFHHIIPLKLYRSDLHTFENIEAVCYDCHKLIHKNKI